MGQKVNPHGLRVGVIKDWDSRWYARPDKVGDLIVEDYKIRKYLKKALYSAGVPTIEIERDSAKVRIYIHCSRPGVVIGKGGAEIERLRLEVEKLIGKPVALSIVEVRTPDTNAQLVAENIAQQLEKRIGFRRAMKNAIGRAMRMGARGIKVKCSGRLGGAEIARNEMYHEGTIPLQTLRADIDYGFAEAATTYGRIGVKVWIYKGEVLSQTLRSTPRTMDLSKPATERRHRDDRRDNRGGYNRDNRGGYNRGPGGQGGYNRGPAGQGGYNRGPAGQGGYNRGPAGQGGYNRGPAGQGGYNRGPAPQGGYNRGPAPQGGYNRGPRPASPAAPAAPAAPQEGGNK
jgi:small subunit ribosomal protein S3